MKRAVVFLVAVVAAAIIGGTFVLLLTPEGRSNIAKLRSWWAEPQEAAQTKAVVQPQAVFAQLNVIDDTRGVLSLDEQKGLFDGLSEKFRDPMSLQIRHLRRTTQNRYGVCGEVNAKNGFGGYVGFEPFVGVIAVGVITQIELLDRELATHHPDYLKMQFAKFGCPI